MATLVPTPVGQYRTCSAVMNLLTAATIASKTTYTETTNDVNVSGWEYIVFIPTYTKGDETGLYSKVELYDGSTWQTVLYKATQSAGSSPVTPDLLSMTATTDGALPPVSVLGFQKARVSFVANGGTPTGTIGCKAVVGITVKR